MEISFGGKTKRFPKLPLLGVNREMCHSSKALRASDVEFMFVRLYNLFFHFQQKKMAHLKSFEIKFWFVCLSFGL
jgi:hypothetical protein